MARKPQLQQFVLLPVSGLRAAAATSGPAVGRFLASVHAAVAAKARFSVQPPAGPTVEMRVLDSIHEDGAKLVEMAPDSVPALRAQQPSIRVVPMVYYRAAVAPQMAVAERVARAGAAKIALKVASKRDGRPVPGATVVAFTDFERRTGAQGTTNAKGEVALALGAKSKKVERLYVYPKLGFWGALQRNVTLKSGMEIRLESVDLAYKDALRYFYGNAPDAAGTGVKVAVVDTGIDLHHKDLRVEGGLNTVVGEDSSDYGDNGEGHGTHVAGILAARGRPPSGIRGLAPAAALRSYRVFGKGKPEASNYSIAKAIDRAVEDGCDVINLSLGGGNPDEATRAAIQDARTSGALVIAAAGNEDRAPVSFPAADSLCIAVSAMGRKGTFPPGSVEAGDVVPPFGKDKHDFVAAFSNVGPEIDLTGTGVGIISTVPGGYAPMDGTSMACPAVTGFAARLLAGLPEVLGMPRDHARAEAMVNAVSRHARSLGLPPTYQGQGLPR